MNIVQGMAGVLVFLLLMACIGGLMVGWVALWENLDERLGLDGWAATVGIFSPVIVLVLGMVFIACATGK